MSWRLDVDQGGAEIVWFAQSAVWVKLSLVVGGMRLVSGFSGFFVWYFGFCLCSSQT